MPLINQSAGEILAKIVYYGPGLCGKTTNLKYIHSRLDPQTRGRLISHETDEERTLFFDLLPVSAGKIGRLSLRYQFYTVPGQVYYNHARQIVLKNVDGIVFCADSQPSRFEANIESMYNLYDNMAMLGYDMDHVPLVIQYNKRDVPGALPISTLEQALNYDCVPSFEAVATQGIGVLETLAEIMRLVEAKIRSTGRV